jgi:hypothetical protein
VIIRVVWVMKIPDLSTEIWAGIFGAFITGVASAMAFWFGSRKNNS